jgi:hypothetical protein
MTAVLEWAWARARNGRGMPWRAAAAAVAVGAVLLVAPPEASAATSCDYSSTGKLLQVLIPASNDIAVLSVASGGQIVVESANGGPTVTCTGGTATVTSTNAIQVFNQSGAQGNRVDIDGANAFVPGASTETAENGGTPEIEIFVNLNGSGELRVFTTSSGGFTRVGTNGINPNAVSTEDEPDADIFLTDVPLQNLLIAGGLGPDSLSAQGGLGTGAPLTQGIRLEGGNGGGGIEGGEDGDTIRGGLGEDALFGRGGPDLILPDGGNDGVDGGPDDDAVSYLGDTTGGVTVDLALTGPQNIGGGGGVDEIVNVEWVFGTSFADTLRGDGGPNKIFADLGDDVLVGRGGVDSLDAGAGTDNLDVRDGGPDTADCGPDTDTVTADAPGVDTLTDCENVLFPAVASAAGGESAGGGAAGSGGRDATAADMRDYRLSEPAFLAASVGGSLGVAPKSARRRRVGTTVQYRLSEPATVAFTVERAARGRRVRGRCRRPTRRNRQAKRCTRFRKLRGSFNHAGRLGPNSFKFTGRLRGRKLSPGRYRLVARATDAAGNQSKAKRVKFRIVER